VGLYLVAPPEWSPNPDCYSKIKERKSIFLDELIEIQGLSEEYGLRYHNASAAEASCRNQERKNA
jgi:hypothetical protein